MLSLPALLVFFSDVSASTPLLTDEALPIPAYPAALIADRGGAGVGASLAAGGAVIAAALQAQALDYLIYIDMAPPPGADMGDPPPQDPRQAPSGVPPQGAIGPPGPPPGGGRPRRAPRRPACPRRRMRPVLLAAALAGCAISADIDGRTWSVEGRAVVFDEGWRASESVGEGPPDALLVAWNDQRATPVALSLYRPPRNPMIAGLFGGGSALDRLAALAPRPAEGTTVRISRIPDCGIQREISRDGQSISQLGVVAGSGLLLAESWGASSESPLALLCPGVR